MRLWHNKRMENPYPDLFQDLGRVLGEPSLARNDLATRILYSTDASIYQHEPLGVVFPRQADDLQAIVETCAAYAVPLLARGSGSSLAGQAIGPALIVDCSRYLNKILSIEPESRTAWVEPGVILNALNQAAGKHGLGFGPDPASAERASLGGCIANNAAGAHSIRYGMAADHLLAAQVILADGSPARFEELDLAQVERLARRDPFRMEQAERLSAIARAALEIRAEQAEAIRQHWPRTWRCASGYALNYLLPWTASRPPQWNATDYPPLSPGRINLAHLLAGSEGTLAVIQRLQLKLVPLPAESVLVVLAYPELAAACEAVAGILENAPSAVELIPYSLVRLARSLPAYAAQLGVLAPLAALGGSLEDGRGALLAVEFSGGAGEALASARNFLASGEIPASSSLLLERSAEQRQVWAVRKVGLGILLSRAGDRKPWAFIEDLAVPVESLGEFVRAMEKIVAAYGTHSEIYAHASAGCLHIRPLVDLKTVRGVADLRGIAAEAVRLALRLGGSVSGEHGDGQARSEWLEQMFGSELVGAFRKLKLAADPLGLLNPGKIVSLDASQPLPRMDSDLRFGPDYRAQPWQSQFSFANQGGLAGAIEQCNGAGVCRKAEGVMCPSFQASGEEMHSTRGRANLLRALISGRFPEPAVGEETVHTALDLCLACKGCKAECPSAVDVARLRYEFIDHYYESHRRPLRDYLFGYIERLARLGQAFAPLANPLLESKTLGGLRQGLLGIARQRSLPGLSRRSLRGLWAAEQTRLPQRPVQEQVLFLSDPFSEYFHPAAGLAALRLLHAAGCQAQILPVIGSGRTLISKGFLKAARRQAEQVFQAIQALDPAGRLAVIGVEPSEILTLRDEYLDFFPGQAAYESLAERAWMIDEFLLRPGPDGAPRLLRIDEHHRRKMPTEKVLLHGHCYQKAQPPAPDGLPGGVGATVRLLQAWGYPVETIEAGCCGMAGAFGYEHEHYALSQQVAELSLLPAIRQAGPGCLVATPGVSCQAQIKDFTNQIVFHPIELLKIDFYADFIVQFNTGKGGPKS